MRSILIAAAVVFSATLSSGTAEARRTVIDSVFDVDGNIIDTTRLEFEGYCSRDGQDCTPQALGTSVLGYEEYLLYSNGALTLGPDALSFDAFNGQLSDFGVPIITALLDNSTGFLGEDGVYIPTRTGDGIFSATFGECNTTDTCQAGPQAPISLLISTEGMTDGAFFIELFRPFEETGVFGFVLPNASFQSDGSFLSARFEFNANGELTSNEVVRATSAVPEPSTWAMLLLGFAAVGYSMRRRRPMSVAGSPA